jgi:hypothetical protein
MYQYSFANTDLILAVPNASGTYKNFTVKGFTSGENLITISRRAPIAATQFGAYGDMVVSMQRIRAVDLTFTVLMNAPENEALQDWCNHFQEMADSSDTNIIQPVQAALYDNMGNDQAICTNGVILQMPAMARGQTMNSITWVITFETGTFVRKEGVQDFG